MTLKKAKIQLVRLSPEGIKRMDGEDAERLLDALGLPTHGMDDELIERLLNKRTALLNELL